SRVADAVAVLGQQATDVGQHVRTGDAAPLRVGDAEHVADIAEAGGRQQRVTQRVSGDVAVGMARAAVGVLETQPQQQARPPRLEWVHVGAEPDPKRVHESAFTSASASSRSSAVVILNASGSPSTTCTWPPMCSTSAASSVAGTSCW